MEDSFQVRGCLFFVAYLNRRCGVRPQASGSQALNRRCGVQPQAGGRPASDGSSCICNRHPVEPLEPSGRLAPARLSYLPLLHAVWACGVSRWTPSLGDLIIPFIYHFKSYTTYSNCTAIYCTCSYLNTRLLQSGKLPVFPRVAQGLMRAAKM